MCDDVLLFIDLLIVVFEGMLRDDVLKIIEFCVCLFVDFVLFLFKVILVFFVLCLRELLFFIKFKKKELCVFGVKVLGIFVVYLLYFVKEFDDVIVSLIDIIKNLKMVVGVELNVVEGVFFVLVYLVLWLVYYFKIGVVDCVVKIVFVFLMLEEVVLVVFVVLMQEMLFEVWFQFWIVGFGEKDQGSLI